MQESEPPVLVLYDGDCSFCRTCAEWVVSRDPEHRLTLIPYQDASGQSLPPKAIKRAPQALQLITKGGDRLEGGDAVLAILAELEWHPRAISVARHFPCRQVTSIGYRVIAQIRGRLGRFANYGTR